MKKLWIVTATTYLRQVKSWSFVILVLSPFLMMAVSLGVGLVSANSASSGNQIAVVADQPALRQAYLKQTAQSDVKRSITTVDAAKKAVKTEKIKGYLVLKSGAQLAATYHGTDSLDVTEKGQLTSALAQLQTQQNVTQAKLSKQQLQTLQQRVAFKEVVQKKTGLAKIAKMASFWILVFMVYMILTTYSSITAQEIASEKGTKVMEIVFSSTTAAKYFCGKILGVLLVIATQLLVYVLGGWASLTVARRLSSAQPFFDQYGTLVDRIVHNLVSVNLVFLFLGVIIYTVLAAFSGALVAKAEDASKASYPAVYLSMIAFFSTFPFQSNADALLVKVLSYVPFFSSYFMPLRVINGNVSVTAVAISLGILALTIILMVLYISHIYKGLILQADEGNFWHRLRRGLSYR